MLYLKVNNKVLVSFKIVSLVIYILSIEILKYFYFIMKISLWIIIVALKDENENNMCFIL